MVLAADVGGTCIHTAPGGRSLQEPAAVLQSPKVSWWKAKVSSSRVARQLVQKTTVGMLLPFAHERQLQKQGLYLPSAFKRGLVKGNTLPLIR